MPELAGQEEPFPEPDNQSKMKRSCENAEHVGKYRSQPVLAENADERCQASLLPMPGSTSETNRDADDLSMIAVHDWQHSRNTTTRPPSSNRYIQRSDGGVDDATPVCGACCRLHMIDVARHEQG